jgi:TRAP-type C4-dicarboxylate transport system substrate-binding protein
MFVSKVNSELKGQVNIEIAGGPEAIPPFELDEAVTKGVIDMCLDSSSYYAAMLPEAEAVMFSNLSALEERRVIYDTMVRLHEKVGLRYLGDTLRGPMVIFTNDPIKSPDDFKGKKLRIFPAIIPFVKSLGAIPVRMKMGDIYSAMDRGVVDGFVKGPFGAIKNYHYHEVTKYVVTHEFYAAAMNVLVNLKKWNQIPKETRNRIVAINHEVYPKIVKHYEKVLANDWKDILDNGIKPIKFSSEDRKAFLNLAYEGGWKRIIGKSPKTGPRLKNMLFKKLQ